MRGEGVDDSHLRAGQGLGFAFRLWFSASAFMVRFSSLVFASGFRLLLSSSVSFRFRSCVSASAFACGSLATPVSVFGFRIQILDYVFSLRIQSPHFSFHALFSCVGFRTLAAGLRLIEGKGSVWVFISIHGQRMGPICLSLAPVRWAWYCLPCTTICLLLLWLKKALVLPLAMIWYFVFSDLPTLSFCLFRHADLARFRTE